MKEKEVLPVNIRPSPSQLALSSFIVAFLRSCVVASLPLSPTPTFSPSLPLITPRPMISSINCTSRSMLSCKLLIKWRINCVQETYPATPRLADHLTRNTLTRRYSTDISQAERRRCSMYHIQQTFQIHTEVYYLFPPSAEIYLKLHNRQEGELYAVKATMETCRRNMKIELKFLPHNFGPNSAYKLLKYEKIDSIINRDACERKKGQQGRVTLMRIALWVVMLVPHHTDTTDPPPLLFE